MWGGCGENRASEDRDLLQLLDGAAPQLGVRLLGFGESLRHGLEVRGVGRVRPAAMEPDLFEAKCERFRRIIKIAPMST